MNDWFRVFGGINIENEEHDKLDEISTTAIAGIRYFTPFMFNLDLRVHNKLCPQISLSREILLFQRMAVFVEYEFHADFAWVDELMSCMKEKILKRKRCSRLVRGNSCPKNFRSWTAMIIGSEQGVDGLPNFKI